MLDPSWQGSVQFYELVFGTWLAHLFLILMWESMFRVSHAEWRFLLITYLASSFFLINHYFQKASFWIYLIHCFTFIFMIIYYQVLVRPLERTLGVWRLSLSVIPFTVVYVAFEFLARHVVRAGYDEFWLQLISFFGYLGLFWWRVPRMNQKQTPFNLH